MDVEYYSRKQSPTYVYLMSPAGWGWTAGTSGPVPTSVVIHMGAGTATAERRTNELHFTVYLYLAFCAAEALLSVPFAF